jgi:hypothetical protein
MSKRKLGEVTRKPSSVFSYTSGRLKMLALPETKRPRFAVYNEMAARGYREVVSYAFVDEQWEQDFAANTHPKRGRLVSGKANIFRRPEV